MLQQNLWISYKSSVQTTGDVNLFLELGYLIDAFAIFLSHQAPHFHCWIIASTIHLLHVKTSSRIFTGPKWISLLITGRLFQVGYTFSLHLWILIPGDWGTKIRNFIRPFDRRVFADSWRITASKIKFNFLVNFLEEPQSRIGKKTNFCLVSSFPVYQQHCLKKKFYLKDFFSNF